MALKTRAGKVDLDNRIVVAGTTMLLSKTGPIADDHNHALRSF